MILLFCIVLVGALAGVYWAMFEAELRRHEEDK